MIKKYFFASLILNVLFLVLLSYLAVKLRLPERIWDKAGALSPAQKMHEVNQSQAREMESFLKSVSGQKNWKIFVGDSITRGATLYFPSLLRRDDVMYAGVDGDGVFGVQARVSAVVDASPSRVFLMVGINDIRSEKSVEEIFGRYREVVRKFRDAGIDVVIQEVLKVGSKDRRQQAVNNEVEKLNALLKQYATEQGIPFVDLSPEMERDGGLRDDLTEDGLHLNFNGYKIWADRVKPLLD